MPTDVPTLEDIRERLAERADSRGVVWERTYEFAEDPDPVDTVTVRLIVRSSGKIEVTESNPLSSATRCATRDPHEAVEALFAVIGRLHLAMSTETDESDPDPRPQLIRDWEDARNAHLVR